MLNVLVHFGLWSVGLADAETQTTTDERDCLARHASGRKRLAEIGVWHGVTTCRLRQAMDPAGTLFAIDPYPKGRLGFSMQRVIASREVSKITNGSVTWVRTTGAEAASGLRSYGLFDFLFIDGDHSYEGLQTDWNAWKDALTGGGIVALHDSRPSPERPIHDAGSVRFTSEVILADRCFEVVDALDSLTVLRRRMAL